MSTIIMAACWPLQGMSASQKAVLISLADQANDDGVCWPAVGTIAARTCLSERAVRDALAWLQTAGVVFREYRANTSTSYTVNPRSYDPNKAPAESKRTTKRKTNVAANAAPPAAAAPGADAAPPANAAVPPANAAPPPANAAGLEGQMPPPNHQLNRQLTANEPSPPALQSGGGEGAPPTDPPVDTENRTEAFKALCRETWKAYADAYLVRYKTEPVRNGKANTTVVNLVKRLGAEAPGVARFFVERVFQDFVVRRCHSIGDLLAQCESYRTQWARDQAVTTESARQVDRTASNANAAKGAAEKALAIVAARKQAAEQKGGGHA